MPSPFPGMDPFIEDQEWEDFHTRFNTALSEALAPGVEPSYVVRVERRVYVERGGTDDDQVRWADVAMVLTTEPNATSAMAATSGGTAVAPVECLVPMPQERRETYLVIRDRETMEIVTIIETLSPANKRTASNGRRQYLEKREEILQSQAHLVELDLLRGGARLPMQTGLPPADYYAIVSRRYRRPRAEVFPWTLRQPLPTIPIPLMRGEPDVPIDLQSVFATVYERARYQLSVNYRVPLESPLAPTEAAWSTSLLAAAQR